MRTPVARGWVSGVVVLVVTWTGCGLLTGRKLSNYKREAIFFISIMMLLLESTLANGFSLNWKEKLHWM